MVPFSLRRAVGVLLVLAGLGPLAVLAQSPPPGRTHLFVLDLAGTPVGEFPTTIKQSQGSMEVVIKDGMPMLKASVTSEFVITLPQGMVLPPDFTLEFELVPKPCCNPPDLSFEGTYPINQGAGSAHVLWDSDGYLAIVGGGGVNYEAAMPEDLRATLPGVLTHVVAVVQGPTIRLYTNGRRHYTLDKQFARGRVLRVSLGVDRERQDPVYLAGLRILAGALPPTALAGNPAPPPGQPAPPVGTLVGGVTKPPGKVAGGSASQSQASTAGSVPTTVSNVSVTQGTAGPVVSWQPVSVAAAYLVRRWKIDDVTCCNNASPASAPLAGPPWQDAPLPVAGTYVYEVTATMSGGVASGQAQFVVFRSGGQIAATTVTGTPTSINPQLPTSPASSGTAIVAGPRTAGASTVTAGPATLAASAIPGWGASVRWAQTAGAVRYDVERGPSAQSFGAFSYVTAATQQAQGGTYGLEDLTVQPGSSTFYRVRAVFSDGTLSPYSPVARYDAPAQVPYVTNLTTLKVFSGPLYPSSPIGRRGVRWAWAAVTGALGYAIQTDVFARDATGALLPVQGGGMRSSSSRNFFEDDLQVSSGNSVRFCISLVFPQSQTDPIQHAVCQMTDIP